MLFHSVHWKVGRKSRSDRKSLADNLFKLETTWHELHVQLWWVKSQMCLSSYFKLETFRLPKWLRGKESAYQAGDPGSILGLERSPGEGNGNPLQYSCLENPMDGGAWRIPWMEEPGRLQSTGLQRVGHDWATSLSQEKKKTKYSLTLRIIQSNIK